MHSCGNKEKDIEDPDLPLAQFPMFYPPIKITKKCKALSLNPMRTMRSTSLETHTIILKFAKPCGMNIEMPKLF